MTASPTLGMLHGVEPAGKPGGGQESGGQLPHVLLIRGVHRRFFFQEEQQHAPIAQQTGRW